MHRGSTAVRTIKPEYSGIRDTRSRPKQPLGNGEPCGAARTAFEQNARLRCKEEQSKELGKHAAAQKLFFLLEGVCSLSATAPVLAGSTYTRAYRMDAANTATLDAALAPALGRTLGWVYDTHSTRAAIRTAVALPRLARCRRGCGRVAQQLQRSEGELSQWDEVARYTWGRGQEVWTGRDLRPCSGFP